MNILLPLLIGAGVVVLVLFAVSMISDWNAGKRAKKELERRQRLIQEKSFKYRW